MSRVLRHKMFLLALLLIGIVPGTTLWGDVTIEDPNKVSASQYIDISLVGHWQFGGDASDSSYFGNNGSLYNGASATEGVLKLDGVDDYVEVAANTHLAVRNELTIAAWVKYNKQSETGDHDIVWDGQNWRYALRRTNDAYRFLIYDTTTATWKVVDTTGMTFDKDKWYHIAATYKNASGGTSGKITIYVNGTYNNELTLPASITLNAHTGYMRFGVAQYLGPGGVWFNGDIDDIKLFNRTLEPWEVRRMYNENYKAYAQFNGLSVTGEAQIDNSLVGYWQFGNDANDSSHYGNDGTAYNGASVTEGILKLDGSNDYVEVPADNSLGVTNELTVAAWVKYNKQSEVGDHDVLWDGEYWRYALRRAGNAYRFLIYDTTGASWKIVDTTGITFDKDKWYHIAATYKNGNKIRIYVNGTYNNELTIATITLNEHTGYIRFGVAQNLGYPGTWFNGDVDELKLFSRALDPWEIRRMCNESYKTYAQFNGLRAAGDIDIGDAGGYSGMKFNATNTTLDFYIDGVKVGHIGTNGTYVDDVP
jgi:protein associated with RNAse G/E